MPLTRDTRTLSIALRDAFNIAKRRLQEYERISRGEVKTHIEPSVVQEAPAA